MGDFLRNHCTGTNAATASTTNSGLNNSGDAFTTSTSGTRVYDTGASAYIKAGGCCIKVSGSSVGAIVGWDRTFTKSVAFRGYYGWDTRPGTAQTTTQLRNATGSVGGLLISADNRLQYNHLGGTVNIGSANDIADHKRYRIEGWARVGTTTSNSELDAVLYNDTDATLVRSINATGLNFGTDPLAAVRFGKITSGNDMTMWMDELAAWDDPPHLIGDYEGDPYDTKTITRRRVLDFTGSVGTVAITQSAGVTATITQVSAYVFNVDFPAHADVIVLPYTITADGPPITGQIVIEADNLHNDYVLIDGSWQ